MALRCLLFNPFASMTIVLIVLQISSTYAQNSPPTMEVHLSLNDGTGVVRAPEDTPVNSLIGIMQVKDKDKGPAGATRCTTDNEFVGLVLMNESMFKISLTRHLDREEVAGFDVSIMCSDMGDPPLTATITFSIVVKDVNDNPPRFSHEIYEAEIPENEIDSTKLNVELHVMDFDSGDNGMIEYTLEDSKGGKSELFEIDPKTGDIYTLAALDREEMQEINLIVRAIDFGIPPLNGSAQVKVLVLDLNDNYPSIVTDTMIVPENLPASTEVGMLSGTDADSGDNAAIVFSMAENQEDASTIPPFFVRPDGTIQAAVPLDRELRSIYTIYVKASDRGHPPLSNVSAITIVVGDDNDNVPIVLRPREDLEFGMEYNGDDDKNSSGVFAIDWYCPVHNRMVYQAQAIDKDEGENARMTYSIALINDIAPELDSLFIIDPDSGKLDLKRCVRDTDSPTQIISLVFSDNGEPSMWAEATLNVTLDVDFTSLTSPIPTTPKPTTTSTEPSSASVCLATSTLLTFSLAVYLLFNICHEFCFR